MKFCFDVKDFIEVDINAKKLAVIGDDFELTWEAFRAKVNETADFLKTQKVGFFLMSVQVTRKHIVKGIYYSIAAFLFLGTLTKKL